MKTLFPLFLLITAAGCSGFTDAQMQLAQQAQKGIELCRQSQQQRSALIDQFHQLQSQRLDEAFDADVRTRPDLSPDWVIEHRRAYRATADAMAAQRQASLAADQATTGNFAAIDLALQRLLYLQGLQSRFTTLDTLLAPLTKPTK